MQEKVDYIVQLIGKYFRNELTAEEDKAFQQWLSADERNRDLLNQYIDDNKMIQKISHYQNLDTTGIWLKTMQLIDNHERKISQWKNFPWKKLIAAAFILIIAGALTYRFVINKPVKKDAARVTIPARKESSQQDTPFGTQAALILADGSIVDLQNVNNGFEKQQGSTKVIKSNNDLHYEIISSAPSQNIAYNTITIPNGGRYRVILPDGSRISLNAGSTVRFSVSSSEIRSVSMTGEAFFEVAENAESPFRLTILSANNAKKADVEVTGTKFNVNAYDDEGLNKISLKEGKIKLSVTPVSSGTLTSLSQNDYFKILSPGQEARFTENSPISIFSNLDTAMFDAWTRRYHYFHHTPLDITLKRLERIYGIKVIKSSQNIPDIPFSGIITPETTCRNVVDALEFQYKKLHLNYDEKKKTIIVSYK